MSSTTVHRTLQLRIHAHGTTTPGDGTVEFTLEHQDFLAGLPPSWGGQVVRYAEGRTEQKPYEVQAVDTNGALTAFLDDNGRLAINGRLAELRLDTDGAGFVTVDLRRITNIHGGSAPQYGIELSDERWAENRTEIFARNSSTQFHPPGVVSEWAGVRPPGQGTYHVHRLSADYVALEVRSPGPKPPRVTPGMVDVLRGDVLDTPTEEGSFGSLRFEDDASTDRAVIGFNVHVEAAGFLDRALRDPLGAGGPLTNPQTSEGNPDGEPWWGNIVLYWPTHGLSSGDIITGRLHWANGVQTTPNTPYLVGGANGIRASVLDEEIGQGLHGGPVQQLDGAAYDAWQALPQAPAWYRLTEAKERKAWREDNLYKPENVVPFVSTSGQLGPKSLRPPQNIDPDTLFEANLSNVRGGVLWRAPAAEAITRILFTHFIRVPVINSIVEFPQDEDAPTATALGIKEFSITTDAIYRFQDARGVFERLKIDVFERFQDSPQTGEFQLLITDDAPEPGDLIVLNHDQLKGPNLATGAKSGKRVVHLVERQRVYSGTDGYYQCTYLDAGPNSQPLATPSVSVAQTSGNEKHSVDAMISSIPAGATGIVEVAHGSSPAAADWRVARTGVDNETIAIDKRPSNTQINVRVTATQPGRIRSAYSTVDDVTTEALTAPSNVSATASGRNVRVTVTLGEDDYPVEYLAEITSGSVDVERRQLPEESAEYTHRAMPASTGMTFTVRHTDEYGGVSAGASDTATTGTDGTAPTMTFITAQRKLGDTGNVVIYDYYPVLPFAVLAARPAERAFDVTFERAPDSGGSPDTGAIVVVATVDGAPVRGTPRRAGELLPEVTYEDPRPIDGRTWWYRARHTREGFNPGTPTNWVKVVMSEVDVWDTPVVLTSLQTIDETASEFYQVYEGQIDIRQTTNVWWGGATDRWATFRVDALDHGMTDVLPTDAVLALQPQTTTQGGASIIGVTGTGSTVVVPLSLFGVLGIASPGADQAAIHLRGNKKDGTSTQALANDELVVRISSSANNLLSIYGNGLLDALRFQIRLGESITFPAAHVVVTRDTAGNTGGTEAAALFANRLTAAATELRLAIEARMRVSAESGFITNAWAMEAFLAVDGAATVTEMNGLRVITHLQSGAGTVTAWRGIRIQSPIVDDGSISTAYGIFVDAISQGGTNYAIYTNAGNIRFGSLAGTGTRTVVADSQGVLSAP